MSLTSLPLADGVQGNPLPNAKNSQSRPLTVESAPQFVHCLLFVQEFVKAKEENREFDLSPVSFFLKRTGGLHLLLLLLNVSFYKRSIGRTKGWPFGVLAARVDISKRSLRQLLADAIAEGVVESRYGHNDRRRVVYCATPKLLAAWNVLFENLLGCLNSVFSNLTDERLVDIDYGDFNPSFPAQDQMPAPADSLYLKSADPAPFEGGSASDKPWLARNSVTRSKP